MNSIVKSKFDIKNVKLTFTAPDGAIAKEMWISKPVFDALTERHQKLQAKKKMINESMV